MCGRLKAVKFSSATSFARQKFAWFTEPKLVQRQNQAQIFPRWNPLTSWMRQIEDFQRASLAAARLSQRPPSHCPAMRQLDALLM